MKTRFIATSISIAIMLHVTDLYATDDPCTSEPEPFNGYWWGGQVQLHEHVAGIPLVFITRFSHREIRHPPCFFGTPVFPPGVGEASVSIGVPILNNRRAGVLLRMAAQGQGSQRPGEAISGMVTGTPAMAGHLNVWETPLPLIQLTGAASAAIQPQSEFPMSVAYLGGVRLYPLYQKHAQANLGLTVGGSNSAVNFIPVFGFRASDLIVFRHRIAIGAEFRTPISLSAGPIPYQWRFWGSLTLTIEKVNERSVHRQPTKSTTSPAVDLVRTAPEAAPSTQTPWETTL